MGANCGKSTEYLKPHPPKERRMPGRPTIKRKRHESETAGVYKKVTGGKIMTCSNCHEKGHSKRSCKNETRPKPGAEPIKIGRPRTSTPIYETGRGRGRRTSVQHQPTAGARRNSRFVVPFNLNDLDDVPDFVEVPVQESQTLSPFHVDESQPVEEEPVQQEEPVQEEEPVQDVARRYIPPFVKRKKSERILKNKLRTPIQYDADGGGSCEEKAWTVD